MVLYLTNFNLTAPQDQRIGWDGENLADTLIVYTDGVEAGDYYLDIADEEGNKNIIALLKHGDTLRTTITREMIGAAGSKFIQMRLCSGTETVKKSNICSIYAGTSVNASEPFQHMSPTEFEEVEKRVSEALQQAADYGVKGDKGDPGEDGEDGVSPTVDTSKSGKVTTITITDATGEHTTTINDGQDGSDGKDGKDGQPGRDGVDGSDGERGGKILRISTAPTPIADSEYKNRISIATVKSEAHTDDVIPGDVLYRTTKYFVVQHVDDTYVYTGFGTDFQGPQGPAGADGAPGADGQDATAYFIDFTLSTVDDSATAGVTFANAYAAWQAGRMLYARDDSGTHGDQYSVYPLVFVSDSQMEFAGFSGGWSMDIVFNDDESATWELTSYYNADDTEQAIQDAIDGLLNESF